MKLTLIALALGLAAPVAETATETDVIAAINALKQEKQVALNAAATPSLEKFVPRSDYAAALNRAETAEKALADDRKAVQGKAVEADIAAALAAGKITPASVDYHRAACASEAGHASFKKFVEGAPVIAPDQTTATGANPSAPSTALNAEEKQLCKVMGMAEADYVKQREKLKAEQRL